VIGTGMCALLYVLVTAAVMGLVPSGKLAADEAPFVSAFQAMFPSSSWAGWGVALIAVISGFGPSSGGPW